MAGAVLDRFMSKVVWNGDEDECWTWEGARSHKGYGFFRVVGRTWQAHRFAYEALVGPIPDGLQIDHLCRHPECVNPAHMEPVTAGENTRRGRAGTLTAERERAKTHCPKGHEYTPDNISLTAGGHRKCRACKRERDRNRYWRNR